MDEAEGVPFLLRRVVARFARRARAALLDARGCSLSAHDGIELMALIEKLCGDAEPPVGCREELRRLYREISRTLYSAREDDETALALEAVERSGPHLRVG